MLRYIFLMIYGLLKLILCPLDWAWNKIFSVPLNVKDKMFFTGVVGGSGKSTAAETVSKRYGHKLVQLDQAKFGPGWVRNTSDVYIGKVDAELKASIDGKYVIDGTYYDQKLPEQTNHNEFLMETADIVAWNHIPKWVAYWRKLFRSFKRYLGLENGAHKESFNNVYNNQLNTWNRYSKRYKILNDKWEESSDASGKWVKYNWPFFYKVK